jgi:hypothetical protein
MTKSAQDIVKELWFSVIVEGDANAVKRMLDAGFDPETEDDSGNTSLGRAALMYNALVNGDVVPIILQALQKKYATNPKGLLVAIDKPGRSQPSALNRLKGVRYSKEKFFGEGVRKAIQCIEEAMLQASTAIINSDQHATQETQSGQQITSEAPSFSSSSVEPNNKLLLHPIRADRTLTLGRLQETKPDGRSNLQIFAEQGQLGDVFTAEIWQGRKDEMDKAWQLVKPEHKNQVNIELVRQQIEAFGLRDRFRRDGNDVGQGF